MQKANEEIREQLREAGIYQWQLANQIGVSPSTVLIWLRTPLTKSRQERVEKAINELIKGATVNA